MHSYNLMAGQGAYPLSFPIVVKIANDTRIRHSRISFDKLRTGRAGEGIQQRSSLRLPLPYEGEGWGEGAKPWLHPR